MLVDMIQYFNKEMKHTKTRKQSTTQNFSSRKHKASFFSFSLSGFTIFNLLTVRILTVSKLKKVKLLSKITK